MAELHKTRRCRGVTYTESYITKYTTYNKIEKIRPASCKVQKILHFRSAGGTRVAVISCKARKAILERKQLSPLQLHSPHVRFVGPASGRGTSKRARVPPGRDHPPQRKSSSSSPLIRTTGRRIPVCSSTNHRDRQTRFALASTQRASNEISRGTRSCVLPRRDHHTKRFRGGLVFKAHGLFVSLNSRLECNKEEEEGRDHRPRARITHRGTI